MSILTKPFSINGVISSDKNVLQNINTLCTAAGCWMSYDVTVGKWSVIINQPGTPVVLFDDHNIIGNINISGSGINELYNSVSVEFPHKDLRDQTDYVEYFVNNADLYPNELPNQLNIKLDCINDPVQAQYIGLVELKQSRVDKIINFRTDYSYMGLKAGDLIAVTSSMYGYSNKTFRITRVEEDDGDVLSINITALEYDSAVYDDSGLIRKYRDKKTGIVPKAANQNIINNESAATTKSLTNGLLNYLPLLLLLLNALSGRNSSTPGALIQCKSFAVNAFEIAESPRLAIEDIWSTTNVTSFVAPYSGRYKINYQIGWGGKAQETGHTAQYYDPITLVSLDGGLSPPCGVYKNSIMLAAVNGVPQNLGEWANTGDASAQLFEDHIVVGFITASAGQTISLGAKFLTDFGPGFNRWYISPFDGASYQYETTPDSVAAVWISGEVIYLGS